MLKFVLPCIFLLSIATAETPGWVNSPAKYCREKIEICVVGTGSGRLFAEQNALKALASYFEAQIKGSLKSGKFLEQESKDGELLSGEVQESIQTAVATFTDQIVEGAVIKKFYEDDEYYYAYATLDRSAAAKKARTELKSIDARLLELLKEKRRTTYAKLLKLYKLREKLNLRYEFLRGHGLTKAVTLTQINQKKAVLLKDRLPVYIKVKGGELTKELKSSIQDFLVQQNFVVLNKRKKNVLAVIGKVEAKKLFLQVKGWEKFRFMFSLTSENKKKQKIGSINFALTKTGRTKKQAFEKALPGIKKYLEENIVDLNLD